MIKDELLWLQDQVQLQVADSERGSGILRFYWDTSDVCLGVLGMAAFYSTAEFDKDEFANKRTLVRLLAAAGWFGTIRMLEPHQAEFLNLLNQEFGMPQGIVPPGGADQFLQQALRNAHLTLTLSSKPSADEVREFIRQQASQAETLFKAVQSLGTWEDRLDDLRKKGLIELKADERFDYSLALENSEFESLRRFLDARRPDVPINNFTDAMALCYLQHLLHEALRTGGPTPVFFASSQVIRDAVLSLSNPAFLAYESKPGEWVPVLRDSQYFLFRASLWPAGNLKSAAGITGDPLVILRDTRDTIRKLVEDDQPLTPELLQEIKVADCTLPEAIEELKKIWFLDRVWLPYAAEYDFNNAAARYVESARALSRSPRYRQQLMQELGETKRSLESNVAEFSEVRQLWVAIRPRVDELRRRYPLPTDKPVDLALVFCLIRFALPHVTEQQVQKSVSALLGEEERLRHNGIVKLIQSCRRRVDSLNDLALTCTLLWILELDVQLDTLAREAKGVMTNPPAWLQLFHAASLLRSHKRTHDAHRIIADLTSRIKPSSSSNSDAMAVGVAYLYFHAWKLERKAATWRSRSGKIDSTPEFIVQAIKYAKQAFGQSTNPKLQAYALNQILYYVTEAADDTSFGQLDDLPRQLIELSTNPVVWQYRYDDTLARYFHRLAVGTSGSQQRELLSMAWEYCTRAWDNAHADPEVQKYRAELAAARSGAFTEGERI